MEYLSSLTESNLSKKMYLVTYDIKENDARDQLHDNITSLEANAKCITASCYGVRSTSEPEDLYQGILKDVGISDGDKVFVIRIEGDFVGTDPKALNKWLNSLSK